MSVNITKGSGKDPDQSPGIAHCINVIRETYGDTVSVRAKAKSLTKFGRNEEVGTGATTIMTLPTSVSSETYRTTNSIDTLSSSSASDTQSVTIEGHTVTNGQLTFVVQTVTLNGQNKVTLPTPLARATRLYTTSTTSFVGVIYVYPNTTISGGVPTDNTAPNLMVRAGRRQSEKASTSISKGDYWLITKIYFDILEKSASFVSVEIETRQWGEGFRQVITKGTQDSTELEFDPPLIIPKNSDIRMVARADGSGTDVSGGMVGYLAKVVG